jgi:hypothetical protein
MNKLKILQEQFKRGELSKHEFINEALLVHQFLFDYVEIIKNIEVIKILISAQGISFFLEDDIQFLNPPLFVNQLNHFLTNHTTWDVVLVAGNNIPPYKVIDDSCVQISKCQTTTGYMVQKHYYDTLMHNIKTGIQKLMKEPEKHIMYAIDKYWFQLQGKDSWYLITPLTVTQREDYSNIEKKHTNYTSLMTDLDKKWMFEQRPTSALPFNTLPSVNPNTIHNSTIRMNKPSQKINMSM